MDPLSIASAASGLAVLCIHSAALLSSWIDETRSVNDEVQAFVEEIRTYSRVLSTIDQNLRLPHVSTAVRQNISGKELWESIQDSLEKCTGTIGELQSLLERFQSRPSNIGKQVLKTIALNRKSDSIVRLRRQIVAYKNTMQLALHMFLIIDNQAGYAGLEDRIENVLHAVQTNLEETQNLQQNLNSYQLDEKLGRHNSIPNTIDSAESLDISDDFPVKVTKAKTQALLSSNIQDEILQNDKYLQRDIHEASPTESALFTNNDDTSKASSSQETSLTNASISAEATAKEVQVYKSLNSVLELAKSTAASSCRTDASSISSQASLSASTLDAFDRWIWHENSPSLVTWAKLEARIPISQPKFGRYDKKKGYTAENLKDLCDEIDKLCRTPEMRPNAASLLKAFFDYWDRNKYVKDRSSLTSSFGKREAAIQGYRLMKADLIKYDKCKVLLQTMQLYPVASQNENQSSKFDSLTIKQVEDEVSYFTKRLSNVNKALDEVESDYIVALEGVCSALTYPLYEAELGIGVGSINDMGESLSRFLVIIDRFEFLTVLQQRGAITTANHGHWPGPLHIAAAHGKTEVIMFLLEQGLDANVEDDLGRTPLLEACRNNHNVAAQILLNHTTNIMAQMRGTQKTALHYAILNHMSETASLILATVPQGVKAEALCIACEHGAEELVHTLLQQNDMRQNIQTQNRHPNPLLPACRRGNIEILRLLLESGFEIDSSAFPSDMQLFDAVKDSNQADAIRLVIEQDKIHFILAKDVTGRTSLHLACEVEVSEHVFQWMVDASSDKNPVDANGVTPLDIAVSKGRLDMLEALVHGGVSLHSREDEGFHLLETALSYQRLDIMKILLDCGANVNSCDGGGTTPLHIAVRSGYAQGTKFILCRGGDPARSDKRMITPLDDAFDNEDILKLFSVCESLNLVYRFAAFRGSEKALRSLTCNGADLKTNDKTICGGLLLSAVDSSMSVCCATGKHITLDVKKDSRIEVNGTPKFTKYTSTILFLLQSGADVEERNERKRTPLHVAASQKSWPIVQILLEAGADQAATDFQGKTPYDLAISAGAKTKEAAPLKLKTTRRLSSSKIISSITKVDNSTYHRWKY